MSTVIRPDRGIPTTTTPTVANTTSVTLLAANNQRKYLLIQNNTGGSIIISLSGATLTGVTPSSTNIGLVIANGASYEAPAHYVSESAITCYQSSGGSVNTIVVVEG